MGEGEGFEVVDEVEYGDLTEVRETRVVIPPTQNVRVRIARATVRNSQDGAVKRIALQVNLVDGIDVEGKFRNKAVFADIDYWADLAVKTTDWYKNKQYLIAFKQLLGALGYPLTGGKVNDEFLSGLVGRELLVNIQVEKETVFDTATGQREDTGGFRNRLRGWKAAP